MAITRFVVELLWRRLSGRNHGQLYIIGLLWGPVPFLVPVCGSQEDVVPEKIPQHEGQRASRGITRNQIQAPRAVNQHATNWASTPPAWSSIGCLCWVRGVSMGIKLDQQAFSAKETRNEGLDFLAGAKLDSAVSI
ncbi:uncharacterized protein [Hetaerina americana]|uniref:uncharacterized protein isoform X2 n=1 Tax=Hetaerina americana TaxID=62018 RepID=UPI003A7F5AB6